MKDAIISFADWLWGWPFAALVITIGLFITIRTGAVQFRHLGFMFKTVFNDLFKKKAVKGSGTLTPFEALSISLSGTVGTGNIAGVATAIAAGGYGAVFWMWILGFFSMITKYSEVILGITYREYNEDLDLYQSGPMYYIKNGLKGNWKWLAMAYALMCGFLQIAYIFVQSNSFTASLDTTFHVPQLYGGIILAVLCYIIVIGGLKGIAKWASKIVPIMVIVYIVCVLYVLITHITSIPSAFGTIIRNAFTGQAAVGGFVGATVRYAIRMGFARGVFTTDAGLGIGGFYHGTAKTEHSVKNGMWGLFEVFLDTIVICTSTALVIVITGSLGATNEAGELLSGFNLSAYAFETAMPGAGQMIVTLCLLLFSFTSAYGVFAGVEVCWAYVFGKKWSNKVATVVRVVLCFAIIYGAVGGFSFVWSFTDTMAAVVMLLNLPVLAYFAPQVGQITKDFFADKKNLDL